MNKIPFNLTMVVTTDTQTHQRQKENVGYRLTCSNPIPSLNIFCVCLQLISFSLINLEPEVEWRLKLDLELNV
jgi:hypothetical protein